ncbi:hypothetical protein [Streptomyces sp. 4F14]|uniref:hypothetical protein n=1 Tax=Streptomyces sp. 4F14 TaxID=3394380 RepID=UPI003A8B9824
MKYEPAMPVRNMVIVSSPDAYHSTRVTTWASPRLRRSSMRFRHCPLAAPPTLIHPHPRVLVVVLERPYYFRP